MRVLGICIPVGLLAVAWMLAPSSLFDSLRDAEALTDRDREIVEATARLVLDRGPRRLAWRVNDRPPEGGVAIWVIGRESALAGRYTAARGRCVYLPDQRAILIDMQGIRRLAAESGATYLADASSDAEAHIRGRERLVLTWVLGHELGHAALGHGSSHFEDAGLGAEVPVDVLSHERELQADRYLSDAIARERDQAMDFLGMIYEVLNGAIRKKLKGPLPAGAGLLYDYTDEQTLTIVRAGSHPEYFVRGVRIARQIADALEISPMQNELDMLIRHLRRTGEAAAELR